MLSLSTNLNSLIVTFLSLFFRRSGPFTCLSSVWTSSKVVDAVEPSMVFPE